MTNEMLNEIKNNIMALQALEERERKLQSNIYEAKREVEQLLAQYEDESFDVEQLKKESFSTTLLKIFDKYDDKLEKETLQMVNAKIKYDKAHSHLEDLSKELEELQSRINTLRIDKRTYEAELRHREEIIRSQMNTEVYRQYESYEESIKKLQHQLTEMDEAITAARRVKNTATSAIGQLESAEGWATYDVWFKGGIISHMAKYSHIDEAEASFNRLSSQLKSLQRELSDIDMPDIPYVSGIDTTTRAIDFWFDNIFTDLNVRGQIRNNLDEVRKLGNKIDRIIAKIGENKAKVQGIIKDIEEKKKDLMVNM